MSFIEFIGGGTLLGILAALWRGLKTMAREEVEREYEDESRTVDLSDINDIRKAIKNELEKEFSKKFEDHKLLYDHLNERFLAQVLENNRTLETLQKLQEDFGNIRLALAAAQKEKDDAVKEANRAKEETRVAIAAAQASDEQARESLQLAERLQEALTKAEMTQNTLNAQAGYLQGYSAGLVTAIRNLPIVTSANPNALLDELAGETIVPKTEEKYDPPPESI